MRQGRHIAGNDRRQGRRLSSVLAAFALGILTFIVQPHVHGASSFGFDAAPAQIEVADAAGQGKGAAFASPAQPSEIACPICHALATSGDPLISHPPALAPGMQSEDMGLHLADDARIARYDGRSWLSRAPPVRV